MSKEKSNLPAPVTAAELFAFLLLAAAMIALALWGSTGGSAREDILHTSQTQTVSDSTVTISVSEIEKFFQNGDGIVNGGRLYYNAQNGSPVDCWAENAYSRVSSSLGSAKGTWKPDIGAPGMMMCEPFRYFVFSPDGIRYMDSKYNSSIRFDAAGDIVRDSGGDVDFGYYGSLLAENETLSLSEFWSVARLIHDNVLIGFKNGVSWFGKTAENGFAIYRFMNGETACMLQDGHAVSGPMTIVENRILLMPSYMGNDKLLLYDVPDQKGMQIVISDEKPMTAWNYAVDNGRICFALGADHYAGSGFISPDDVMNPDYNWTPISKTKVTTPEAITIHRSSSGEMMMYYADAQSISARKIDER